MKAGVVRFPGSNCDRDCFYVLRDVIGAETRFLWHKDHDIKGLDLIVLPGGFSYGDYLRCGAIARFSPIMEQVAEFAEKGGFVLGICNGFQILTEARLLPGVLMRNRDMRFICKYLHLRVENNNTAYTGKYRKGQIINIPVAHGDGSYMVDDAEWAAVKEQVVFRYCTPEGEVNDSFNPNGARDNVAGIINRRGNVLGMMPHPERSAEAMMAGRDGYALFDSVKSILEIH